MVNQPRETPLQDLIAYEAGLLGLAQALSLTPATARAALERAMRTLATPPSGPLTEPAGGFDVAAQSRQP